MLWCLQEEDEEDEVEEELFLRLLPDELLTPDESDQENRDDNKTGLLSGRRRRRQVSVRVSPDSRSSQNASPAAVQLTGGSLSTGPPTTAAAPESQEAELLHIIPKIQNVMSTVKLGCCLDLKLIACKKWNIEYKPKTFKALIMRIREPRTTALIYRTGNLVCTGAKSVEESRLAARKFVRIVKKLGFPVASPTFKVQNLVGSCNTFPVRLTQMARNLDCSYEPELFPALFYKVLPGICATIFSSGKIHFTGAKTEARIHKAFDIIRPILSSFRRR
ncbi:uncharacterized protein [Embiotoca jacksoni]|uniref:uncharacterized protein n=1 Tax=Embiotoca jacksoni TaxID=100190 RepID=UPI00370481B6